MNKFSGGFTGGKDGMKGLDVCISSSTFWILKTVLSWVGRRG